MKKLLKMTSDKQRITFFGWSHLIGWTIAWLQTVWIVWLMMKYHRKLMEAINECK